MAFQLKRANCVVAGTFNMYIVQPAWLAKVGIVPKGIGVIIGAKLDEPGFRFSSQKLPFRWYVTPARIEFDTESSEEDCGNKVADVLKALPWTPLQALGNNAIYSAPLAELGTLPEGFRTMPAVPGNYELARRSFQFALTREERVANLQLSITSEELELSINTHTELRGRDNANAAAQTAARRFLLDRKEGEDLIRYLFKADIEHGNGGKKPA